MTATDTTRHASGCRFMTPPDTMGPRVPDVSCPRCAARLAAMGWPQRYAAPLETLYDETALTAGHPVRWPDTVRLDSIAAVQHSEDCLCFDHSEPEPDSIAALDREDVEFAIEKLRLASRFFDSPRGLRFRNMLARVADALAEHLIERKD